MQRRRRRRPMPCMIITTPATSTPMGITPMPRRHDTLLLACIHPVPTLISLRRTCTATRARLHTLGASHNSLRLREILATCPRSKASPIRQTRPSITPPYRAIPTFRPRVLLIVPRLHRRHHGQAHTVLRRIMRLQVCNPRLVRRATSAPGSVREGPGYPRIGRLFSSHGPHVI